MLRPQRIMVKATYKSDLRWSAIFSVIVYWSLCSFAWLVILYVSSLAVNLNNVFCLPSSVQQNPAFKKVHFKKTRHWNFFKTLNL